MIRSSYCACHPIIEMRYFMNHVTPPHCSSDVHLTTLLVGDTTNLTSLYCRHTSTVRCTLNHTISRRYYKPYLTLLQTYKYCACHPTIKMRYFMSHLTPPHCSSDIHLTTLLVGDTTNLTSLYCRHTSTVRCTLNHTISRR